MFQFFIIKDSLHLLCVFVIIGARYGTTYMVETVWKSNERFHLWCPVVIRLH